MSRVGLERELQPMLARDFTRAPEIRGGMRDGRRRVASRRDHERVARKRARIRAAHAKRFEEALALRSIGEYEPVLDAHHRNLHAARAHVVEIFLARYAR